GAAAASRRCRMPAPPPEPHPLSLHDALPISDAQRHYQLFNDVIAAAFMCNLSRVVTINVTQQLSTFDGDWHQNIAHQGHLAEERSEEHTSELQSRENLVCRLLLEKKKRRAKM